MEDLPKTERFLIHTETVVIGDVSSRLSSIIFFLLCFIPVFSTIMFGAVDNTTWIFISIFCAAIAFLWLAEAWKGQGFLFNPSSIQIPLIGLITIGLVQLLPLAGGDADSLLGIRASHALSLEPYATRFFVIRLLIYFVFFAACLAFINNDRRFKKAVLLVVIFGALMAFFGIMQRLADPDSIYGMRTMTQAIAFGPFVNQHHFASFMQMTGGVTLGLLLGKSTVRDKKILLAFALIIMGVAVVLTSSRGGLIGFASVVMFVALLNFLSGRRPGESRKDAISATGIQRKIAMAVGAVAFFVVIFGTVLFIGGNDSLLRGIGITNAGSGADLSTGRFHFWPIAISIFLEHPIIGAGFDAFGVAFTRYDTWSGQFRVEQAHNDYLQTLADAGLAGFACVAGFVYLLFKKGLATIVKSTGFRREAAIGALAGCFGIMIHSFFDFPLRTPSNAFFFLFLCAIITVPTQSNSSRSKRRRHSSPSEPSPPHLSSRTASQT
ncbi:MAG: O-antigen ligase family protein [Pyrinomonadaceae bacterium]